MPPLRLLAGVALPQETAQGGRKGVGTHLLRRPRLDVDAIVRVPEQDGARAEAPGARLGEERSEALARVGRLEAISTLTAPPLTAPPH